jgi:hypothetical protein
MKFRTHLTALSAIALLTPIAAFAGLFEPTLDNLLRALGPLAGVVAALAVIGALPRRRR